MQADSSEKRFSTIGELGDALCRLKTQDEADELWQAYVEHLGKSDKLGGKTPEQVASSNIGYMMGYYDTEDRQRVYGLFPQASHPIFGRFEHEPTPGEAIAGGERMMES